MKSTSRSRLAASVFVTVWAALGTACGDLVAEPVSGNLVATETDASFPSLPPSFIDAAAQKDIIASCDSEAPVEGTFCGTLGLTCELGASPDMRCNTTLECATDGTGSGTWKARPSTLCPSYQCPTGSAAAIADTPCDVPSSDAGPPADADELVCPMSDAVCACTTGADAAHAHARRWVCVKPASGCPTARPLVGQSCELTEACDYGGCSFKRGMRMQCEANVWISGSTQCN